MDERDVTWRYVDFPQIYYLMSSLAANLRFLSRMTSLMQRFGHVCSQHDSQEPTSGNNPNVP